MERMVTEYRYGHGVIEHLHRYSFVIPFIKNKRVLDIASGEGYGSNLMADHATEVIGVDISAASVDQALRKYRKKNLKYLTGSATAIPLADRSVDVVVSFETLEHLVEQDEMIREIARVLKTGGCLIISTPERDNYHPTDPNNPYHLKELSSEEFTRLLNRYFTYVKIFRQRFVSASIIYDEGTSFSDIGESQGNFDGLTDTESFLGKHLFNIAVASLGEPVHMPVSFQIFNGNAVMDAHTRYYQGVINELFESRTYRVGRFLLRPFSYLKSLLKK